jgi:hypothetical protein
VSRVGELILSRPVRWRRSAALQRQRSAETLTLTSINADATAYNARQRAGKRANVGGAWSGLGIAPTWKKRAPVVVGALRRWRPGCISAKRERADGVVGRYPANAGAAGASACRSSDSVSSRRTPHAACIWL